MSGGSAGFGTLSKSEIIPGVVPFLITVTKAWWKSNSGKEVTFWLMVVEISIHHGGKDTCAGGLPVPASLYRSGLTAVLVLQDVATPSPLFGCWGVEPQFPKLA